ncbi:MAG: DUF4363 family protein [Oscillospiraceae bacterium]|nr:DUF4363 family protein [Oscillospiraceae bacterium]
MKRLTVTIIIFLISIIICIGGLAYIKAKKDEYSNLLHLAYKQAQDGNLEDAKKNVDKFQKRWDANEKYLMFLIHREDLGEIAFAARSIKEYINAEELPEFYSELNRIMALLDHLWETEVPLPENIF